MPKSPEPPKAPVNGNAHFDWSPVNVQDEDMGDYLLDIYPTLAELCKLPAKKSLEGNSIVPLLKNPAAAWDHPSVTTHGFGNHAVRSEKWRYIQYKDGSEELYDHETDPNEWKNLATDAKYAAVKKQLAKSLPVVNTKDAPTAKEGKE